MATRSLFYFETLPGVYPLNAQEDAQSTAVKKTLHSAADFSEHLQLTVCYSSDHTLLNLPSTHLHTAPLPPDSYLYNFGIHSEPLINRARCHKNTVPRRISRDHTTPTNQAQRYTNCGVYSMTKPILSYYTYTLPKMATPFSHVRAEKTGSCT